MELKKEGGVQLTTFWEATHLIASFTIPPIPIGADHTYLSFSIIGDNILHSSPARTPHTTIHFTHELAPLSSAEVEYGLCLLHPSTPLSVLTSHISSVLHTSAISSFPHTTHRGRTPPPGTMPQNRWYDDECRELPTPPCMTGPGRDHRERGQTTDEDTDTPKTAYI